MFQNKNISAILYALLIYIPTLKGIGPIAFVVPFLFTLLGGVRIYKSDYILKVLLLICFFSLINFTLHIPQLGTTSRSILSEFPYALLFLMAYVIASNIDDRVIVVLLLLICIEIIIGGYMYQSGKYFEISEDFLYNKRVTGLSNSASVFASKIFLGIMLAYIVKHHFKYTFLIAIYGLLFIGSYITFNRTFLLSSVSFIIISNYKILYKKSKIAISLIIVFLITLYFYEGEVLYQFTRGSDNMTRILSGRDVIWSNYISFIKDNPIFGYGSAKLWYQVDYKVVHPHNTYIMTLASNGILISLLYLYMLVYGLKKQSFIFIVPILISGLTQYSFLWGCGLFDIFLFYFLRDDKTYGSKLF